MVFIDADDSPGATKNSLNASTEFLKRAIYLLTSYKIPVDGYLVAWQYYIGRNVTCNTYAAIWRHDTQSSTYIRITETLLLPEDNTKGVKFQFVQNSPILVKKGDILGIHVDSSDSNCPSITYRDGGPVLQIYKDQSVQLTRPSTISSPINNPKNRTVPLRAYIAGEWMECICQIDHLPQCVE